MPQIITKKNIDPPSISRIPQDGFLDIFLSFGIAFAVIVIATDLFWLGGILAASLIPVWAGARHSLTALRRDGKSPSRQRKGWSRVLYTAFTILGVLTLALGLVMYGLFDTGNSPAGLLAWFSNNLLVAGWIFGAVLLSLVALLMGITRYCLYAFLAVIAGIWGPLLNIPPILYLVGLGALMLLIGLATHIRFLRIQEE